MSECEGQGHYVHYYRPYNTVDLGYTKFAMHEIKSSIRENDIRDEENMKCWEAADGIT